MILAAPLVIPFAKAVGLSVGALGMAALADQVNEYIQENPEESMKILSTIIPGAGIGQIFMSKEDKISLEDLDEMTDEEAQDLSKEEKAELMKQAGKSGGKDKRQTMIDISEKLGLSGEGKEKQDIEYDIDERYDEGGVEEVSKPKFDYKKFFRNRRADGGAIGIEVLFEEKKPRKNFQEGGYEPLFTEDVETFTAPIGLNTTTVPSRIGKAFEDASNEAFRVGSVAARTGLTDPTSIMNASPVPIGLSLDMMSRQQSEPFSNPYSKFEKQGLSSDYRHTLGTSAFKDSIIDYLGSNLGINKQSGILDTIGSLAAKGATVFEEGKDALSQLKAYQDIDPYSGIQDYGVIPSGLKLSEILAQPIEDFEANFFAADQIPFGTSPLKKMEMIQAYRKFGMDNYMQQLENQKKAAMQEQIKKAEAEAAALANAKRIGRRPGTGGDGPGVKDSGGPTGGYSYDSGGRKGFGYGLKEGGRVGFDLGGLTGPAKNIYDFMSAAGYFTEDEIRNAIIGAGYEIPGASPTQPAQPEQVTGIINQQLQTGGGRDDNKTGFGKFGNLDPTTERTFVKDVYTIDKNAAPGAPMTGSFKPTEVTGYLNVNTGNYQTLEGKNINHAGINFKPGIIALMEAMGLGEPKNLTGLPYKEGQIAGTFTGKKLSDFNPFNLFKKQQATLADIQAMNKKAVDELRAKQAAEKAAKEAAIAAEMARYNITSDSDFGGGVPGGGGGNVRTSGGDVYGGAAYGYNEAEEKTDYYKDGGLATMFVEKR